MFKQDWMMRQIETMTLAIAHLVFNKQDTLYLPSAVEADRTSDDLYQKLTALIDAGALNEAENLLYEETDPANARTLEVALDFYARINDLSDQQLAAGGFSREEIEDGLKDVLARFGVALP